MPRGARLLQHALERHQAVGAGDAAQARRTGWHGVALALLTGAAAGALAPGLSGAGMPWEQVTDDTPIFAAAQAAQEAGLDFQRDAWAFVTPCHWRVGADHIAMDNPARLALDEPDSRALLEALAGEDVLDCVVLGQQLSCLAADPVRSRLYAADYTGAITAMRFLPCFARSATWFTV